MTLLTANEVAAQLGLSQTKIYDLARSGDLPCYRFGSSVRFDQQEVKGYIQSCQSIETKKRVASILNLTASSKVKESGLESSFRALGIKLKRMPMTGRNQPDSMLSSTESSAQVLPLKMRSAGT